MSWRSVVLALCSLAHTHKHRQLVTDNPQSFLILHFFHSHLPPIDLEIPRIGYLP